MVRSVVTFDAGIARWTRTLLVACAFAWLPNAAWATCGDYLHLPDHSAGSTASSSHVQPLSTPQTPCRGPNCRRSNLPASPTAPFSLERPGDQWACAEDAAVALPALSRPRMVILDVHAVEGNPQRLERPPR